MNIEKFYADRQERADRESQLKNKIDDDKAKLAELNKEYEQAIMKDNDDKTDEIYPELEKLKRGIKQDTFKLEKTTEINKKEILENAHKAIGSYIDIKPKYEEEVKDINEKMKPILDEVIQLKEEAKKLEEEYKNEIRRYTGLAERYGIRYGISNSYSGLSYNSGLEATDDIFVKVVMNGQEY